MVPHHPQGKSNLPAMGVSRNRHLRGSPASFLITSKAPGAHKYCIDCFTQILLTPVQMPVSLESLPLSTSCDETLFAPCLRGVFVSPLGLVLMDSSCSLHASVTL